MPEFMSIIDVVTLTIFSPLSPSNPPFPPPTIPSSYHQQLEMLGSAPGKVIIILYHSYCLYSSWSVCMKQTQVYHVLFLWVELIAFLFYFTG